MRLSSFFLTLLLLTACSHQPAAPEHPITLDDNDWQPVNQGYITQNNINSKDF